MRAVAADPGPTLDRPIFVVGHPRSGTTLLASMLGRHPQIASTPESLYLSQARFQLHPLRAGGPQGLARRIMASPLCHLVPSPERLVSDLSAHWPVDERTVFTLLLDAFRRTEGKPRVLEKSPLHLRHLHELARWYPDAKFIWILRDPRACVASLIKVPFATDDPIVLARQWARNVGFGLSADLPSEMLTTVRFEDLVAEAETRRTIERLCAFVDVPLCDRLFDHQAKVRTVKASETWKANVARPMMSDRANAWRNELSPEVQTRILAITKSKLVRLGYSADGEDGRPTFEAARSAVLYSRPAIKLMQMMFPLVRHTQSRLKRAYHRSGPTSV